LWDGWVFLKRIPNEMETGLFCLKLSTTQPLFYTKPFYGSISMSGKASDDCIGIEDGGLTGSEKWQIMSTGF
jgi:hypothetical protein